MKISELIKHLDDNLTDEQKQMDAEVLDDTGSTWTINTILFAAVGEGGVKEGQPILAGFEASPRA